MAEVLIEGTVNPCWELARGEQRRVRYTDHVQRLADRGFIEVLEWYEDPPKPDDKPKRGARGGNRARARKPQPERVAAEGPAPGRPVDQTGETST